MTRSLRAGGAALVAAALFATLAPAARGAAKPSIQVRDGVTQPVFSYEAAIRETIYVQSTLDQDLDGDLDLLAADIIRPKESDAGLKVPVILEMSPYYQTVGRGNESELKAEEDGDYSPEFYPLFYDNYFVPRGYAVMLQDLRGTRNSDGCMVLGGREDLLDAQATIDWLNGKGAAFTADGEPVEASWSTGQVGMIGKSYDGTIANGAASIGIDGLETIVPISAISRWYDYAGNNGVQYQNAYLTPFSVWDTDPGSDEERGAEWYEGTATQYGPCSALYATVMARSANPVADHDDFWDARDYLKDADKVKASVFVIHGLNDWNVKPNNYVQWWKALAKNDVPRKIWLGLPGHVDPFDFRREEWVDTLHRWFDFWLHDIDNGIMDEPMSDVERSPGRWITESTWPAPGARPTKLFLAPANDSAPGTLSLRAPEASTQSFTDDPTQPESAMVDGETQAKESRLVYLTPPLRRSVRISGPTMVDLRASVDRADTNLTALLVDYGPGTPFPVVEEAVRTLDTETCHGSSTQQDDACYREVEEISNLAVREIVSRGWLDGKHYESERRTTPIVPTQPHRFKWEIFGDDYVFARGHRIGLVIAGSDLDRTIPDPNLATVTVALQASKIILPVVGGPRRLAH